MRERIDQTGYGVSGFHAIKPSVVVPHGRWSSPIIRVYTLSVNGIDGRSRFPGARLRLLLLLRLG